MTAPQDAVPMAEEVARGTGVLPSEVDVKPTVGVHVPADVRPLADGLDEAAEGGLEVVRADAPSALVDGLVASVLDAVAALALRDAFGVSPVAVLLVVAWQSRWLARRLVAGRAGPAAAPARPCGGAMDGPAAHARLGTTVTGIGLYCATEDATLPSRSLRNGPRPREPTTMPSASSSSATSRSAARGSPSTTRTR